MANFVTKIISNIQKFITPRTILIALHSCLVTLCIIGSFIFISDILSSQPQTLQPQNSFSYWTIQAISQQFNRFIQFIKIKIIIPLIILTYFYYCIKSKVFQNLLKEDYKKLYQQKYSQMHKLQIESRKKSQKLPSSIDKKSVSQNSFTDTRKDFFSNQADQSLNISKQMIKSMSKSILGSARSMTNQNLTQSMIQKGNLSLRSSKIIQNMSKRITQGNQGKDLMNLFDKGRNMSQSFMSASSSGLEGQDVKIRIKAKRYYDFSNQKQGEQFKKWYNQTNSKYLQEMKSRKQDVRSRYMDLLQLKRGIQNQLRAFLKQYKQNSESLKQCVVKFWCIKIQQFDSKKPLKMGYQLEDLFKQKDNQNLNILTKLNDSRDILIKEKDLFKKCSSSKQFIQNINKSQIKLRNINQKQHAQKQLTILLSKRQYLNTLLNISLIQGQLFSQLQIVKIKSIQKSLQLLNPNKIQIFNPSRNQFENNELDLLEQFDIQTIQQMIQLRKTILVYLVNKINLMNSQKHFKVKMKQALTYDSGFLTIAINFFKNQYFAQIVQQKNADNVFSHFNLKVHKKGKAQQPAKDIIINCKPGVDNSLSVLYYLIKEIGQYLNQHDSYNRVSNYQNKNQQSSFKSFIQTFYINRRL